VIAIEAVEQGRDGYAVRGWGCLGFHGKIQGNDS
jgi:hypothetical protein